MSSVPPPHYEHPGPPPWRPELPEGVWRPEPPPAPKRAAGLPRWPVWSPFAAMLGTLVVAVVGVGVIALVVELAGVDTTGPTPPGFTIGGTFVQDLALIGAAWALAQLLDPPATARKFGLRLPPLRAAIGWTALAWAGFFLFSALWALALNIHEYDNLPD